MNITIKVNNITIVLPANTTVLQACEYLNLNIPKFCFHKNLEIAGNCRMCLVEVKNNPKPVVSCSTPILNNMEIFTDTPLVHKARESVLEFLLLNHPLDCPVCDQGGECDLQDQTLQYGSDKSRFFFNKRIVENKICGPFIKTIMTRCIHCTRCIRFASEICNIDNLGATGRGNKTEISFYVSKIFNSEFSGNVIDLCPVGALTSKTSAFQTRSWELKKTETIDLLDSIGSTIEVHTLNNKIIKIVPKLNQKINIEWISNKTRFFHDSIKYQRITKPMFSKNNQFYLTTWPNIFTKILIQLKKVDGNHCKVLIGDFIDIKSLYWLKQFCSNLGISDINYFTKNKKQNYNAIIPNNFVSNTLFSTLENADTCLLINCNTRAESPILNLRLLNKIKSNNLQIYTIGETVDLTYPTVQLGLTVKTLIQIIKGKHAFCKKILNSNNFTIIIGSKSYTIAQLIKKSKYLNKNIQVLHPTVGFLNFLETFGLSKLYKLHKTKLLFLYNTNILPNDLKKIINDNPRIFIIYIGHHFTQNAEQANLLLPCTTFLEKSSLYLTNTGLIYNIPAVLKKINKIRSDSNIFKSLIICLKNMNQISMNSGLSFKKMYKYLYISPFLFNIDINSKVTHIIHNKGIYNSIFKSISHNSTQSRTIFENYSKILTSSIKYFNKNFTNS